MDFSGWIPDCTGNGFKGIDSGFFLQRDSGFQELDSEFQCPVYSDSTSITLHGGGGGEIPCYSKFCGLQIAAFQFVMC